MMMQNKKTILVTHNGSFHADDIFACATLAILLERKGQDFEVIRTRDEETVKNADYVFDVGTVYDPATNRFDHHQVGGAGKHSNGVEYASFGLVWEKFGAELCGGEEAAQIIEKKLVSPIDAGDNGQDLIEPTEEVKPYLIQIAFRAMRPSWKNMSEETLYSAFLECVELAKKILSKEIAFAVDTLEAQKDVARCYEDAENKKIVILDRKYPWEEQIVKYPEPLFVVFPRINDGLWGVEAVPAVLYTFERRKNFPAGWAGLRDEELQKVTGVADAVFCHRAKYMAVAKSKEGAIKLAQIALES